MSTLTLEQLQANLRHLAERLEYGMDDDGCDMSMDLDAIASVLHGLADGQSGDAIGDALELPSEPIS